MRVPLKLLTEWIEASAWLTHRVGRQYPSFLEHTVSATCYYLSRLLGLGDVPRTQSIICDKSYFKSTTGTCHLTGCHRGPTLSTSITRPPSLYGNMIALTCSAAAMLGKICFSSDDLLQTLCILRLLGLASGNGLRHL